MLWLLKELRSGELIPVLYSAYSLLCIALALVLAFKRTIKSCLLNDEQFETLLSSAFAWTTVARV